MPTVLDATRWRELSESFETLEEIVRNEGGENVLPGVRAINRILTTVPPESPDADSALGDVRSIYKGLRSHKGLLSDFFIWRDDFAERQRANVPYDELIARIGDLLAT